MKKAKHILKIKAMVLGLVAIFGCSGEEGPPTWEPVMRLGISNFSGCNELQFYVWNQLETKRQRELELMRYWEERQEDNEDIIALDSAPAGSSFDDNSSEETFTNVQESGVDEADSVKVGTHHIFVAKSRKKLEVVNRANLDYLGSLTFSYDLMPELFTDGNQMILLGVSSGSTLIKVYRVLPGEMPSLISERSMSGNYYHSRLVEGKLVLAFRDYLSNTSYGYASEIPVPLNPVKIEAGGKVGGVSCDCLVKPRVENYDFGMTKIASLDTRSEDLPVSTIGVLGGGEHLYMTQNNIYLSGSDYFRGWRVNGNDRLLIVTKVGFNGENNEITPLAVGAVEGWVKDQWAFKEYADHDALSIATTTRNGGLKNHLWVLKHNEGKLDLVASVRDFGATEDIRAIRYVRNMAYVVTFKKTDPLFAIDMTDPLNPRMMGELVIPGFSTYLHPVSEDRLVGVGFDVDDQGRFAWFRGIQISLFDVSDPMNLSRLDNITMGDRGSYSEVTSNHHAFHFDSENNVVGIPIVELTSDEGSLSNHYGTKVSFSGVNFFKVERGGLKKLSSVSHYDFIPGLCQQRLAQGQWWQHPGRSLDINRVFKVDGKLLAISRFAITQHIADSPLEVIHSVTFPQDDAENCSTSSYY